MEIVGGYDRDVGTAYTVTLSPDARADLGNCRAFDRQTIVDAIELHLPNEPTRASRSRIKKMDQPFWSQYRLRVGDYRVYYDVDVAAKAVLVLRVLFKGVGITPRTSP